MKAWKRNLLIAYLACSLAVTVLFWVLGMGSGAGGFVKFVYFLLGAAALAGFAVGVYVVVYAFAHEHATLHAGPDGSINIERIALESTARRALATVPGISLQKVVANVIARKGEPVIDLTLTAVPYGTDSLMVTAGRMQSAVKRAVESFTDHEVRYVAVNFVEPRKRAEVKAAHDAVDARAAADYVAPRYPGYTGSSDMEPDPVEPVSRPVAGPADGPREAGRPSLWDKVRERAGELRARRAERDEDVVETVAVVESVSFDGEAPAANASVEKPAVQVPDAAVQPDEAVGPEAVAVPEPVEGDEAPGAAAGSAEPAGSAGEADAPGESAQAVAEHVDERGI